MYVLLTKMDKANRHIIRNNNSNPEYSIHILSTGYAYGGITDVIKIMKIEKKAKHLITLERYHIYAIMIVETDDT